MAVCYGASTLAASWRAARVVRALRRRRLQVAPEELAERNGGDGGGLCAKNAGPEPDGMKAGCKGVPDLVAIESPFGPDDRQDGESTRPKLLDGGETCRVALFREEQWQILRMPRRDLAVEHRPRDRRYSAALGLFCGAASDAMPAIGACASGTAHGALGCEDDNLARTQLRGLLDSPLELVLLEERLCQNQAERRFTLARGFISELDDGAMAIDRNDHAVPLQTAPIAQENCASGAETSHVEVVQRRSTDDGGATGQRTWRDDEPWKAHWAAVFAKVRVTQPASSKRRVTMTPVAS